MPDTGLTLPTRLPRIITAKQEKARREKAFNKGVWALCAAQPVEEDQWTKQQADALNNLRDVLREVADAFEFELPGPIAR